VSIRIITGDALEQLRLLPADSVHCCVTSPPYYGLRDYGTAQWDGGDVGCDHAAARRAIGNSPSLKSTLTTNNGRGPLPGDKFSAGSQFGYAARCLCGARRVDRQIGLEPSPDCYVAALVAVFREVRRVLRRDGTLWVVIGDSYAAVNRGENARPRVETLAGIQVGNPHSDIRTRSEVIAAQKAARIKPKDLIGIPWMLAFALRADGWWLRQDIIWSKPNPMPESVTDRCTKAHEYLFLLSKSDRYWFDAATIAEQCVEPTSSRPAGPRKADLAVGGIVDQRTAAGFGRGVSWGETRNKRSVWTVASEPFAEAHFATFPPALIEPCILAGCPRGGTVLDPFAGAGTTGMVADRLGRDAILIELNPAYAAMAWRRIEDDAGMFAQLEAAD
jgi:DNA modification methylase